MPLTEAQLGEAGVTLKAHNIVMLASDLLLQHPAARDARESDWGTLAITAIVSPWPWPPICCCSILLLASDLLLLHPAARATGVDSGGVGAAPPGLRGSLRSPAAAGETHT